jgi:hypothetical protein
MLPVVHSNDPGRQRPGQETHATAALRAASVMARRVGEALHFITFARTLDYCNNSNPHLTCTIEASILITRH